MFLGYGRGAAFGDVAWTTSQAASISSCVKSGLRQFYSPPPIGGAVYSWSFLTPSFSAVLAQDEQSIDLPDDFGGIEGRVTISISGSSMWSPIKIDGIGTVQNLFAAYPEQTGNPRVGAIEPLKGTGLASGQRFRLAIFPIADQDYTLQFTYYVLPSALDGSRPYCYGGAAHTETILASCKAAAERDLDDMSDGPQYRHFMECLAASIAVDRRFRPQSLGYNGDRSNHLWSWQRRDRFQNEVTYNGDSLA